MNKNIAILTSGGDSPGMNAVIRAVVRTAILKKFKVFSVRCGYNGLLTGDMETVIKGLDIDKPRNLAKRVTVE